MTGNQNREKNFSDYKYKEYMNSFFFFFYLQSLICNLLSDESLFMIFGSDRIKHIRRPLGKRFDPKSKLPTVKHGSGNIMV